jgi:uncharacterized membrane protein YkvA (DUF1232 family)
VTTHSRPAAALARIRSWAAALKRDVVTLWFAYRHRDTPWYAKLWAALVVGYAFSPLDLIPDFIPLIGWLDDLVLLPAGIWIALKLVPPHALAAGRLEAEAWLAAKRAAPRSMVTAVVIVLCWALLATLTAWWVWHD